MLSRECCGGGGCICKAGCMREDGKREPFPNGTHPTPRASHGIRARRARRRVSAEGRTKRACSRSRRHAL
eukprot:7166791-Heterocapsa_arctica.AAC.1